MKFEIIIIDDTIEVGLALEGILESLGYKSRYFEDPISGLNYFKQELNPLVFLDVNLPIKSGLEILTEIKKINPITQVIMMTGEREIEFVIKSLENKASDFLLKPFTISSVTTSITRSLNYFSLIKEKESYQEAIERDLRFTAKLQKKIISPPIDSEKVFVDFYPISQVSSDFYEIIELKNGNKLIFFGDIEGTGVASGFVALLVLSMFKDISREIYNPAEILTLINKDLNTKLNTHTLAAVCTLLDFRNNKIVYSVGGIPPPILFKKTFESCSLLTHSKNQIIGVIPDLKFDVEELTFEEDDVLYIYSDGFYNSKTNDLKVNHGKLIDSIIEVHSKYPKDFSSIKSLLKKFIIDEKEKDSFKDDLSFLLYQF